MAGASDFFTCTCCDNKEQVVAKCDKCNDYLCEDGLGSHQRLKALRDHDLVIFETVTEEKSTTPTEKAIPKPKASVDKVAKNLSKLELKNDRWATFDELYDAQRNTCFKLIEYWKKQEMKGVPWYEAMTSRYLSYLEETRKNVEKEKNGDVSELIDRYFQVAKICDAIGNHSVALQLLHVAISKEESSANKRQDKLADLYYNAADVYTSMLNSVVDLKDVNPEHIEKQIAYLEKARDLRRDLKGEDNEFEFARILMALGAALSDQWEEGGEGAEDARQRGRKVIDEAVNIFLKLNAKGCATSCLVTKATLESPGSQQKEERYLEALELCKEVYGVNSALSGQIHYNMYLLYYNPGPKEDDHKAYEWLMKTKDIYERVYGKHHPETQSVYEALKEDIFVDIQNELVTAK